MLEFLEAKQRTHSGEDHGLLESKYGCYLSESHLISIKFSYLCCGVCLILFIAAVDDEDRNILARKANERISFSAEEDSWVSFIEMLSRFYGVMLKFGQL